MDLMGAVAGGAFRHEMASFTDSLVEFASHMGALIIFWVRHRDLMTI